MPMIEAKLTRAMSEAEKEELKADFGKLIENLGKTESYLMVNIQDSQDLWFGGRKLEDGAYVSVSLLGDAGSALYNKMTAAVCDVLASKYGIPGQNTYVTYHPVSDWGWNGRNF
ncbi:MAG: hypothetical protein J5379_00680 [Clostridiales bacterium]|nr:hypothetical protein [Clostridiales bacterium]